MRTNINILCLLLTAFAVLPARAQDATTYFKSLLESGRITAVYQYDVDGSVPANGCGTAVIEGNCFRISGGGIEMLCDGSAVYTVDTRAKEAYIEMADGASGLLADPRRFLEGIKDLKYDASSVSGSFSHPESGTVRFMLSDIRKATPSGNREEFRFDTASAGPDWVVTDLRQH